MTEVIIKNISKKFPKKKGRLKVFENLSCSIKSNKFYCLFGPSGCGKTTILNIIASLTSPDSGRVIFKTQKAFPISYVFQENRLLPWKTAGENINFVLRAQQFTTLERKKLIKKYLKLVGLEKRENCFPQSLSGGEKQRVAIARALAIKPRLILMDEPFAHLDELTARFLRVDLMKIWQNHPTTVLFVTHNPLEAIYLADEIFALSQKPTKILKKITVNLPRPRSEKFYEDFVFQKKTKNLLRQIFSFDYQ